MDKKELVKEFVNELKEFKPLLEEHLEYNNELLPHVFFGECNDYFIEFLKDDNSEELKKLFGFFERMATKGDEYVQELLSVTILERLGDDKNILSKAYQYMGVYTRMDSDNIEKQLGRY